MLNSENMKYKLDQIIHSVALSNISLCRRIKKDTTICSSDSKLELIILSIWSIKISLPVEFMDLLPKGQSILILLPLMSLLRKNLLISLWNKIINLPLKIYSTLLKRWKLKKDNLYKYQDIDLKIFKWEKFNHINSKTMIYLTLLMLSLGIWALREEEQ